MIFRVTIASEDTEYDIEVEARDMFSAVFAAGCQVTNHPARYPRKQGSAKWAVTSVDTVAR